MTTNNPISTALDSLDPKSITHEHDLLKVINREEYNDVPARHFENLAFSLHENHCRSGSKEWTGYFIPLMTGRDEKGNERPTVAEAIPVAALDYWALRSAEAPCPLFRARYADLVWEFGGLANMKARGKFAIHAFEAYKEVGAFDSGFQFQLRQAALSRCLELARSLRDNSRLGTTANRIAQEGCSEAQRQPFWAASLLTENREARLVEHELSDQLEALMLKLIHDGRASDQILRPAMLLEWMRRLVAYRRARPGDAQETQRLVRELAVDVLAKVAEMDGLIALNALYTVRELAASVGIQAELGAIDAAIVDAGSRSADEMSEISVPIEIPKKEIERFLAWAIGDDFDRSLIRTVIGPLPRQAKIESVAEVCMGQFEGFSTATTITSDGRPGSVAAGEGIEERRLARARSICLLEARLFTQCGLRELLKRQELSVRSLAQVLREYSPRFMEDSQTNRAIAHAFRHKRWPVATTLLALRIEPLLLTLGRATQVRCLRPNAAGGLNATSTESLITDAEMRAAMGEKLSILLDHVFEPQGLRHSIAHGQRRDDQFSEDDAITALQAVIGLNEAIARSVVSSSDRPAEDTSPRNASGSE